MRGEVVVCVAITGYILEYGAVVRGLRRYGGAAVCVVVNSGLEKS